MIRVDAQPTPDGELRRQILSKCVEKSEREWWAARTIEKLEFELNTANSEIERLRKANLQLREGAEEQKQRIKWLEEAGDEMADLLEGRAVTWIKAREVKP